MQEVSFRKGDFNESKVTKMSKEPQVPLRGLIGKDNFGELVDIKGKRSLWRTCGYQRSNGREK